jgi:hypothetical protein
MTIRISFLHEQGMKCDLTMISDNFDLATAHDAAWTNRISQLLALICDACWKSAPQATLEVKSLLSVLGLWQAKLPSSFQAWAAANSSEGPFPVFKSVDSCHAIAWQFYYAAKVLSAVHLAPALASHSILALNCHTQHHILEPLRHLCAVTMSCIPVGVEINGSHLLGWCG